LSKKKIIEGKCAVCGNSGRLSFEHVPPRSAFNEKPILIQNHTHLFETESYLYEKNSKSNKGFGAYTLCESCNNNTGGQYAKDFAEFAIQAMNYLRAHEGPHGLHSIPFKIKPLNVIKQIITMFFSANKGTILSADKDLVDFILDKEKRGLPNKYQLYLYYTLSKNKRLNGNGTQRTAEGKFVNWSEINFQPFGYLLALESPPPNEYMANITEFAKHNYDSEVELKISAGYLSISSFLTGEYDNA
jgi:hypothetical protein